MMASRLSLLGLINEPAPLQTQRKSYGQPVEKPGFSHLVHELVTIQQVADQGQRQQPQAELGAVRLIFLDQDLNGIRIFQYNATIEEYVQFQVI